jgi:hypothetical protein
MTPIEGIVQAELRGASFAGLRAAKTSSPSPLGEGRAGAIVPTPSSLSSGPMLIGFGLRGQERLSSAGPHPSLSQKESAIGYQPVAALGFHENPSV